MIYYSCAYRYVKKLRDDRQAVFVIGFYFPINYMEGVQVDFERLAEWTSFDSKQDYLDIINR